MTFFDDRLDSILDECPHSVPRQALFIAEEGIEIQKVNTRKAAQRSSPSAEELSKGVSRLMLVCRHQGRQA